MGDLHYARTLSTHVRRRESAPTANDGGVSWLFAPDPTIGHDWQRVRTALRLSPERTLQLAVLEEAMRVLVNRRGVRSAANDEERAEIVDWLGSDAQHSPFAFAAICDSLRLDPDWVRTGIMRLVAEGHNGSGSRTPA